MPTVGCNTRPVRIFDIDTLRMEMTSFSELVFNPVSQGEICAHRNGGLRDRGHVYYGDQRTGIYCADGSAMLHYARLPSVPSSVLWRLSARCNSETVVRMKSRKYNR